MICPVSVTHDDFLSKNAWWRKRDHHILQRIKRFVSFQLPMRDCSWKCLVAETALSDTTNLPIFGWQKNVIPVENFSSVAETDDVKFEALPMFELSNFLTQACSMMVWCKLDHLSEILTHILKRTKLNEFSPSVKKFKLSSSFSIENLVGKDDKRQILSATSADHSNNRNQIIRPSPPSMVQDFSDGRRSETSPRGTAAGTVNDDGDESESVGGDASPTPPLAANMFSECGDASSLRNVQCRLEARDLWTKFHELGTEMIITKSGRWDNF
uniref:T-box domain-containing protein n=1 Tax=Romanomermis culicivorax TaxID=13658 RepID=A0A915JUE8_ROMCU